MYWGRVETECLCDLSYAMKMRCASENPLYIHAVYSTRLLAFDVKPILSEILAVATNTHSVFR